MMLNEISEEIRKGELLAVSVVARKLMCGRGAILNWICESKVKGIKIGN